MIPAYGGRVIRDATEDDVLGIGALADRRRAEYELAQPVFWRRAPDAVERHLPWLSGLVADPAVVSLVAVTGASLDGYVFASVVAAPPVYDPGGPTGVIDDFAVADPALWTSAGRDLLDALRGHLADRGVAQIVVVCGHHDQPKRQALLAAGMTVASEWFVAPL
jgi:hypothetical protein